MNHNLDPNALGLSLALVASLFMGGLVILAPFGVYTGALRQMLYWHMFFSLDPAGIFLGLLECAVWAYLAGLVVAFFYNCLVTLTTDNSMFDWSNKSFLRMTAFLVTGILLFLAGMFLHPYLLGDNNSNSLARSKHTYEPTKSVTLAYTWQNLGPKLVKNGAVNIQRLEQIYKKKGRALSKKQRAFFEEGSDQSIKITRKNSGFVLNTLWALGITNKNSLLDEGRMGRLVKAKQAGRLASTGGWILGNKPGGDLLNSASILELSPEQQKRVENVVENAYRPCCNNPASFPDCNHGAAALGLAELLAAQGASPREINRALKQANELWFPRQYRILKVYFEKIRDQSWGKVKPDVVLGKNYSSTRGYKTIKRKLQRKGLLPEKTGNNPDCSV